MKKRETPVSKLERLAPPIEVKIPAVRSMKVLKEMSKVKVNEIKLDVSASTENIYANNRNEKELSRGYSNISLPPLVRSSDERPQVWLPATHLGESKRQPRNSNFVPARLSINNLRTLEQL